MSSEQTDRMTEVSKNSGYRLKHTKTQKEKPEPENPQIKLNLGNVSMKTLAFKINQYIDEQLRNNIYDRE